MKEIITKGVDTLIVEFIKEELKTNNLLLISEYFLENTRIDSLYDSFLIYSEYIDEDRVKELLKSNKNVLEQEETLILELINKLEKLECIDKRKTIKTEDVKAVIDSYRDDLSLKNIFINNLKFNGTTVQKSTLDKKLLNEKKNVRTRQRVLTQILELEKIKELIASEAEEGKELEWIIQQFKKDDIKFIKYEKDALFYDNNKVIIKNIDNIKNFIKEILSIKFNENNETMFFRGHADIKWKLIPSIYREQWIKYEDVLFKESIVRHPKEFNEYKSTFEKLTKMQHYELPTSTTFGNNVCTS